MKTQYRTAQFRIVSSILSLPLVLCALVITIALAAQPAKAVSIVGYTLNLTEVSSTLLTYTYNGPSTFSILNTGPDTWTLSVLTGAASFNANFIADWIEPEEPSEVNEVRNPSYSPSTTLFITSDLSTMAYYGDATTTYPDGALVQAGTDNGGQPLFLRFVDQASSSESVAVPDTGSTLGLLALSAAVLFGLRRFRFARVV